MPQINSANTKFTGLLYTVLTVDFLPAVHQIFDLVFLSKMVEKSNSFFHTKSALFHTSCLHV